MKPSVFYKPLWIIVLLAIILFLTSNFSKAHDRGVSGIQKSSACLPDSAYLVEI